MAFGSRDPLDHFDTFLDALARSARTGGLAEAPTDGLDPSLTETVRRLRALDGAGAPAPALANHIWEELMNATGLAGTLPLPPTAGPAVNGRAAPRPWRSYLPALPVSKERRRLAYAQLATVVMLLITLLGILFTFRQPEQRIAAPPDVGTPLPAATVIPDMPMFGGNPARTGEHPGPGPVGAPTVRWRFRLGEPGQVYVFGPAVADGVAYVVGTNAGQATLYALDAATGQERWQTPLDDSSVYPVVGGTFPTVAGGLVYVTTGSAFGPGALHAFDAATGQERWRFDAERWFGTSHPAVVDGVVYLASGGGGFAPAVVDGVVYVAGGSDQDGPAETVLHALDAASGVPRWELTMDDPGYYAVEAATGTQRWFAETSGLQGNTPAVADGVVYGGDWGGNLYALDVATGQERWRFAVSLTVWRAAVVDGVVYVGSDDGRLYALDAATGEERWRFATGDVVRSAPAVVDGVVYVSSRDGNLYAVDAATGQERWRSDAAAGNPVVVAGVVYVGHGGGSLAGEGDGYLYALADPPAGSATAAPAQ